MYVEEKVVGNMKKVFVVMMLLFLSGCSSTEENQYKEQCEKVYYCSEWLEENASVNDLELQNGVLEQLSYFGDTIEEIKANYEIMDQLQRKHDDLDELQRLETITFELLDEDVEYDVEVVIKNLRYYYITVEETESLEKVDEFSEFLALEHINEQIKLIYNELNYYFDEEIRVEYIVKVPEDYLNGEINYTISVEYIDEVSFFSSNRIDVQWEYVRGLLYDELDYNMVLNIDKLQPDHNDPTTPRLAISGFTIDEIFLATGDKTYEEQAFEVYNEVRDFLIEKEFPFVELDLIVMVQKEYLVLNVAIMDDGTTQEVEEYSIPLNEYFNRKFKTIIETNHVENTTYQTESLQVEFINSNTVDLKLYVKDATMPYESLEELDVKINAMVSELKTEFETHGYNVSSVNYHFHLVVKIDTIFTIVTGKHIISTNPLDEVDWYDVYLGENE